MLSLKTESGLISRKKGGNMFKESGIYLPAIHHVWKGIIERPSMVKILIQNKQLRKNVFLCICYDYPRHDY